MAARMAMMAITTSNSIKVNPLVPFLFIFILISCLCPVLPSDHSLGPVKSQTHIPIIAVDESLSTPVALRPFVHRW
jgi:hypothetical protein